MSETTEDTPEMLEVTLADRTLRIDPTTGPEFWGRVVAGTWEPETIEALRATLSQDSAFVDIGAWIGPLSLLAAALGASVTAFELDPVALLRLDRNLVSMANSFCP